MAVTLWKLNSELAPMRAELKRYRQQLGFLSIPESESDQIHAIQVESEHEHEWRYRIYLPKGNQYVLRFADGTLPARTADVIQPKDYYAAVAKRSSGSSRSWEPGEFVLAFRVRPDEDDPDRETWKFETRRVGEGSKGSTTLTVPWMADTRAWSTSGSMVSREQKSFDPAEPLPLLTVRRAKVTETARGGHTTTVPDSRKEAEGFMLWIESKP